MTLRVMDLDTNRWVESHGGSRRNFFITSAGETRDMSRDLSESLARLSHEDRSLEIQSFIRSQVAKVLRVPVSELEHMRDFSELGVDSLLAVEIRNALEKSMTLTLPVSIIWNHPSFESLGEFLLAKIFPENGDESADDERMRILDDIEDLTEEEARSILEGDSHARF